MKKIILDLTDEDATRYEAALRARYNARAVPVARLFDVAICEVASIQTATSARAAKATEADPEREDLYLAALEARTAFSLEDLRAALAIVGSRDNLDAAIALSTGSPLDLVTIARHVAEAKKP